MPSDTLDRSTTDRVRRRARFSLASNFPWKLNLVGCYSEICEKLERFRSTRQAPSQTDICVNRMGARHICQGK